MVTHVNSTSFEQEVTNAKGLVVADFWAEWCGPCKRYGPTFEEVAKKYGDQVKFIKINVEEAEDIAADLGVQSIPTTIFFKDGQPEERITGMMNKEMLTQKVEELRH
jgi:thioredoxin 1